MGHALMLRREFRRGGRAAVQPAGRAEALVNLSSNALLPKHRGNAPQHRLGSDGGPASLASPVTVSVDNNPSL